MKTINSLCSKLLAFTLALMASVASFAYDEMPPDFKVDGLYYNFLEGDNVEVTHPYRPALPTESASNAATQDSPDDYANLTELTIPSTVTYEGNVYHVTRIGHHAFDQCENLTSVDIPNSIKSIGIRAFSWCSALTSMVLKGGLENIESYAFEYCLGLENISLPNSLMTIGQNAFYNTQWYKNQPNGGVYVGNVFYKYKGDIPQNTSFVIKEGTVSISPYAFVKENYHEDYSLVSVSIPNSVKVIGEGVFYRCRALTSIVIPAGVTTIETLAFDYCKALKSVTCEAVNPPALSGSVFLFTPIADATLYVPAESIEAYKTATEWKDFGQILPIKPTSYKSQWCDTWNIFVENGSVYPPHEETYRYQLAQDIVIGDYTYTTVVSKAINDALDAPRYVAAVRFTDDRKVYIYYDNAEYLLYDFNVQQGDELEVFAGINNYRFGIKTYKCIVTGVEQYACIGCPATITLHVPNHPDDFTEIYRRTQWQEGVGDVYSGFLNGVNGYVPVDGGGSVHLLCAYKGDELKYTGMFHENYGCGDDAEQTPEDLFPTLWGLQQTICSGYYGEEGDEWASGLTGPSQEITMMDGKPYLQWGSWYLREENDKILVYSEIQKKDLVLYDFTLELGDTLTTLNLVTPEFLEYEGIVGIVDYPLSDYDYTYPIDTLVVTELSKETLLDGKEYTRWKFSDGTVYVEGIGSMSETFFHHIADHLPVPVSYLGSYLVCVSKNNKLLYQMDDAEMERLGTECLCDVETSYKDQWCNKWNVMFFDGMRFDETASTSQYRLGKDTIIGDYIYSKFIPGTFVRFTDDRKVYVYHEGFDDHDPYTEDLPTGEYLAYDFSAQVGDTLEVFSGVGTYSTYPCVVDDVQIDSETNLRTMTLHKICRIDEDEYDDMEMTWIEGVGSPEGFLISYRPCGWVGGGTYALLCAYQDDELKYTDSFYERFGCDYKAGVVSDDLFPTLSGLQRTICREYCEQADNKTRMEQFTNLTTRTETGAPYIYYSPFLLREEDNKILIYSRSLDKDLVLYDFNLQVGDSLPMLYIDFFAEDDWIADSDMEIWCVVDYHKDLEGNILPADTLIVTDVSAITLLDGKEYKKWTFNNGMEYLEGIGSFGNRQWSGDFFQLIGNMDIPVSLHGEHLVCASKNGQLLYQMDEEEMERLGAECLCDVEKKWSDTWCNQWNILSHGYQGPRKPLVAARTSIFWLSNNTVNRNGQEYIPLMCSSSMPEVESTTLIGELRFTEDKQVYFNYDNTEYLLYDFDVQVGDTLDIFGGIELYSYSFVEQKTYPHVITKIDTLDDGRLQITSDAIVIFEDGEVGTFEEKQQQIWIEGLGSINGIVHTGINPGIGGNPAIVMLCAYRDDECVYKTDSNDPYWIDYTQLGCVYNAGDFIEGAFPILSGLQRTVCNEYCGETEDDNSANNTYKQTFDKIFFENDKPYILCNDYLLREEDNKILLYSQSLNKDIVLYDFTLEVGDSLPAYIKDFDGTMYSDDILVVTDISSVTLLDGKEYKKWTFNNGMEYVEGIGMYGGRRNGNFFGLIQEIVVPCHTGTHLVCVSKNGKLLYQMDEAEMERLGAECLCDYDRGPRKDNAKDGQIGGRPTPTQWNQLELDLREMENGTTILRAETFSYTLENDSIVANDKIFYQLARQSTKDTATTKSFVGALHFGKEEDNRVYFLRDGVEYVLYDFTAEPGDTVEIFAGINNYPQDSTYTHVVVDKDTTEDGACRMFLEVVFPEETTTATNAEKVWLAGLGSIDGIVHNTATRISNAHATPARSAHSSDTQTSVMLCAWREDSCLYITDHPDYNDMGCIYNQDPTSIEDTHSPSPTTDYQKLLRDGQLLIIHKGKTYNVLGVQVK